MDHGHVRIVAVVSWSLFLFWAPLPNGQLRGCETGFFGKTCKTKCHCTNDKCDPSGDCTNNSRCQGGWFGPACQYSDLAFGKSLHPMTSDGTDETCLDDPDLRRVTVKLGAHFYTKWIRLILSKPGYAQNIWPRFRQLNKFFSCGNLTRLSSDDKTVDMLCNTSLDVMEVTIRGAGVGYLCSVHVSGGRNIALRQEASLISLYNETINQTQLSLSANLAVDGNTNPDFLRGHSCSHFMVKRNQSWGVRMSSPKLVNRYVVYNAHTFSHRLIGFSLYSYDGQGKVVFQFKDRFPVAQMQYTATHVDREVQVVKIVTSTNETILTLCEVEVYGESICDTGYFGLNCEKACNCYSQEECFVSTGGCPDGCFPGYMGEDCSTPCTEDMHGHRCSLNCSENCVKDALDIRLCDHETGHCLHGCENGYLPPTCLSACGPGTYGPACSSHCSPFCVKSSAASDSFCNAADGTCLFGCYPGYYGSACRLPCQPARYGKDCKSVCSKDCLPGNYSESSICNHETGACINGCADGYGGLLCQYKISSENLNELLLVSKIELVGMLSSAVFFAVLLSVCTVLLCRSKKTVLNTLDEESYGDTGSDVSEHQDD